MRSSTVIALLGGASLAAASPIGNLLKKAVIWDIVVETVVVTVTEGQLPATPIADDSTTTVVVQNTVIVNPVPAPTPEVVAPAPAVIALPPAPTTTAPAPVAPAPAPVVEAPAPVVEAPAPVTQVAAVEAEAAGAAPSDFVSTGLYHHNVHRSNHSASALTWDADLAENAQVLANRCVFAHDSSIGGGGYGQNIAMTGMGIPQNPTAAQLADLDASTKAWNKGHILGSSISNQWYNSEEPVFASIYEAYGKAQPEPETKGQYLHFTQVVWKDTTKVGCAVNYCGSSMSPDSVTWLIVCNYASAGNFRGEYATNVGRPNLKATVTAPEPSS